MMESMKPDIDIQYVHEITNEVFKFQCVLAGLKMQNEYKSFPIGDPLNIEHENEW